MDFNITSHKCWVDNISSKFDFQGQGHCGYIKKNFVIALVPTFNDGF